MRIYRDNKKRPTKPDKRAFNDELNEIDLDQAKVRKANNGKNIRKRFKG